MAVGALLRVACTCASCAVGVAPWAWLVEALRVDHRRTLVIVWVRTAGDGEIGAASTVAGVAGVFAALGGIVVRWLMCCTLGVP